jgi:hypothetical protein
MDSSSSSSSDADNVPRGHVMGWVVGCGARVYFGPPPNSENDLRYLRKTLRIRNIVSLKPLTGRLTFSRDDDYAPSVDTSIWYAKKDAKITVHTYPLGDQSTLDSMKDDDMVEVYIGLARKIKSSVPGPTPVYIHHKEGFTHEAYVAMALWRLEVRAGGGIPKDPVVWMKDQGHIQVVRMAADKEMLTRVWNRTCTYATGIGSMFTKMKVAQNNSHDDGEEGGGEKKKKKKRKKGE